MGHLLGQIVHRNYPETGVIISALVKYLNLNDAGPGFYDMAVHYGKLPKRPTSDGYLFWAEEVKRIYAYYARPPRRVYGAVTTDAPCQTIRISGG
jgi:hypothetical protein